MLVSAMVVSKWAQAPFFLLQAMLVAQAVGDLVASGAAGVAAVFVPGQ